jgi:hypothetical protein
LYALSWYNSMSSTAIILIDIDGNTKWQYSTPDSSTSNNMIKYKEIDESTNMVIATSGSTRINYNRIISSSTSPYSVLDTKTFRDTVSPTGRELYAIYIIDLNNAVSLIYDTVDLTFLAKINFLTQSISY